MKSTLVIVKPDAVERGLVGEIISRFERAGFQIEQMLFGSLGEERIHRLYAEHEGKTYFPRLIAYMTSGPCCYLQLTREGAAVRARMLVGATDPSEAPPGTIRGDLGLDLPRNSVHASDGADAARREAGLIFGDGAKSPAQ